MPQMPLKNLIPRLVDKWSFELLHRAKMGETPAMVQVAQIQFSRHGWGRIKSDPVQGRRWLEYGASRGDPIAASSLQNLRIMMAAREKDLIIAREAGIIDMAKRGADGKALPVSEQAKLPPLNFNRLTSKNPYNNIEATSEEEFLGIFSKEHFKPIEDTIQNQRLLLLKDNSPAAKQRLQRIDTLLSQRAGADVEEVLGRQAAEKLAKQRSEEAIRQQQQQNVRPSVTSPKSTPESTDSIPRPHMFRPIQDHADRPQLR